MKRQAVILDRDGVINEHRRFVNKPADFILYERTPAAIRLLNTAGFLVLVATNQGGVGLGFLSEADLKNIHQVMLEQLREKGARIDDILACTHAPQEHCECRKPNPGMLETFISRYQLSPSRTYMVGDRVTDVKAGKRAGVRTVYIGEELPDADSPAGDEPLTADYIAADLLDAARWICSEISQ